MPEECIFLQWQVSIFQKGQAQLIIHAVISEVGMMLWKRRNAARRCNVADGSIVAVWGSRTTGSDTPSDIPLSYRDRTEIKTLKSLVPAKGLEPLTP